MKYIFINMFFLFACYLTSSAIEVEYPDYTFKSPEALSFQRQGQFQVGEYTGSPNISFPLYTVKYRDIELPLILSYNSSGVQVAAEASWVGLNWDLNVGGCINLIPCGEVDELHTGTPSSRYEEYNSILNKRNETDYYLEYNTDPKDPSHILSNEIIIDGQRGLTESDIYSVSLPSGSFHFYIKRETGKAEIIGADCKDSIERYTTLEKKDAWRIIDSNGYTYEFECPERSQTPTGIPYTSAWFLTKIKSPTGSELALQYIKNSLNLDFSPKMRETVSLYMGIEYMEGRSEGIGLIEKTNSLRRSFHGKSTVEKRYLQSITAGDQIVYFNLSKRDDLNGGKKLDSISIFEYGSQLNKICFDYEYFQSNTRGGDYLVEYYDRKSTDDFSKKRLKLKSFYYKSETQEVSDLHSFVYNESKGFPNKNSFAVDMWGYYNGKENKINEYGTNAHYHTFCPAPRYCDLDKDTYEKVKMYNGADRFADSYYVDALSLTKIIYPTKGYTEFIYEPNTFIKDYKNPLASGRTDIAYREEHVVQDTNYDYDNYYGGPTRLDTFNIERETTGTLYVEIDAGKGYLKDLDGSEPGSYVTLIVHPGNGRQPIRIANIIIETSDNRSTTKKFTKEINVTLPPGKYMFSATLSERVGRETGASVKGTLTFDNIHNSTNGMDEGEIQAIGGGIRIRSIKNYDSNDTLLEETDYEYIDENGNSSGKHIMPNRFYQHKVIYEYVVRPNLFGDGGASEFAKVHRLQILDNPIGVTPFVYAMHNNNVGYSRVVKRVKDKDRVQVSTYSNEAVSFSMYKPEYYNGYSYNTNELGTQIHPKNGCLLTQEILDSDYNLVHKVTNAYKYNPVRKKVNFTVEDEGISNVNTQPGYLPILVTCYSFENYWVRLTSTTSTDYKNGSPTTVKNIAYQYDKDNLQVKMIEESTGNAEEKIKTKIDYTTSRLDDTSIQMKDRNILNAVVRERKFLCNGTTEKEISSKMTSYSKYYNQYYAPSSVAYSIGGNPLETRTRYQYTTKMNVCSVAIDDMETVYIWSYNGQYPIAKIEGLSYSKIKDAVGESTLSALLDKTPSLESDLSALRTAVKNMGGRITTYTYKPLVGMTSQTLTNGLTTEYEYDGFGRLSSIKRDSNILQKFYYNYKNR